MIDYIQSENLLKPCNPFKTIQERKNQDLPFIHSFFKRHIIDDFDDDHQHILISHMIF